MPSPSSSKGTEGDKKQAASDLKKAGQKVAEAGGQMGDQSTQQQPGAEQSSEKASQSQQGGDEEEDPLVPDSDSAGESEVFADMDAEPASDNGEGDPTDASGAPATAGGDLAEEILAAQKALEEAGIAMQTAGGMLETAASDEELAVAEAALAKARIAVIVAGQDLTEVRQVMQESGGGSDDLERVLDETEGALSDANVAIVVATQTILGGIPELGGLPQGMGLPGEEGESGKKGGRTGQLDDELNESLVIFDDKIMQARRVLTDGEDPENAAGSAIIIGTIGDSDVVEETDDPQDGTIAQQGRMQEGSETPEEIDIATLSQIPEDIPGPQGDDIVAKQLREAAMAEVDAALQEKLWEEYRRYKSGI